MSADISYTAGVFHAVRHFTNPTGFISMETFVSIVHVAQKYFGILYKKIKGEGGAFVENI